MTGGGFTADHLVILSSVQRVNMTEWRHYLEREWPSLMRKNSRLLVLGGVHGKKSGAVGRGDAGLLEDSQGQIMLLKRSFAKDIEHKNIVMEMVDISEYTLPNSRKMDDVKLVDVVRRFQPTVLILASCWTKQSVLNGVFRSSGIYSVMIMQEELAGITKGRHIFLDAKQKEIIEKVADDDNNVKNLLLWGSSGTGKTLLLLEALRIKLSQAAKESVKVRVIVTAYWPECKLLMDRLKSGLNLDTDIAVNYYSSAKELCEEVGVEYRRHEAQETLNGLFSKLAEDDSCRKTIVVVDEILIRYFDSGQGTRKAGDTDWSDLTTRPGVEYLIALSPYSNGHLLSSGGNFSGITPPNDENTFSSQLLLRHRNSYEIQRLFLFYVEHIQRLTNTLPITLDEAAVSERLPPGRIPVMIETSRFEDEPVDFVMALDYVAGKYVLQGESVTVLAHPPYIEDAKIAKWCADKNGKLFNGSTDEENGVKWRGSEDEVIVELGVAKNKLMSFLEVLTRARLMYVKVVEWGQGDDTEGYLRMAADHAEMEACGPRYLRKQCDFLGEKLIVKEMLRKSDCDR